MKLFSASRLETFQNCKLRGYYAYVCYWKPQTRSSYAADFGSCIHAALDGIATAENKKNALERGLARFNSKWHELEMPEGEEFDRNLDDLRAHTPTVAKAILEGYIARNFARNKMLKLLSVEQEFILPFLKFGKEDIFIRGKIDKIYKSAPGVRGIDHKTTSAYKAPGNFRDDFLSSFYPNDQMTLYSWILGTLYGNMGQNEMIVDAILVWENAKGTVTAYTQLPLTHSEEDIEQWKISTESVISDILARVEGSKFVRENLSDPEVLNYFPRNTSHCIGKYGRCPYYQLCAYNSKPLLPMTEPPPGYEFDQKRFEEDQRYEKRL